MPGGYDGDIKLKVDLTPGDVKKASVALGQELRKIFDSSAGKKTSAQFKTLQAEASKALYELEKLYDKMKELEGTKVPTKEFQKLSDAIKQAQKEYKDLTKGMSDAEKEGLPRAFRGATEQRKLQIKQALELRDYIRQMQQQGQEMLSNGTAFQSAELSDEYRDLASQADDLNNKLTINKQKLLATGQACGTLKSAISSTVGKLGALARRLASVVSTKIISGLKRLGSHILRIGQRARSSGIGLKQLFLAGIGINSLTSLFSKLRSAVQEGLGNLEQYSPAFKATMDSFRNSLMSLKNSFGAAFAPILSAVIPALNALISTVNAAITAIAKLIALLGGRKTFTRAVTGLNNVAGAAGGAGGAAKELQKTLAGFDDVEILKSDNSGGGGGGGGGADFSNMFEEVPIDDEFAKLVDMIKEAWAKADFTEIGTLIGEKLRDALESIPWDKIKPVVWRVAHSLATLLNGFLETPGLFDAIGTTIGEALNTALIGLNEFAKTFHWDSLGLAISDSINAFFRTAKPKLAANTFSNWVKGILETIYTAIENVDWRQVGEWIKEFLVNVDWAGILAGIAETIGAVFGGLGALIAGALGDVPGQIKQYFAEKIEEQKDTFGDTGTAIFAGILAGILEAVTGVGDWIKTNVLEPFARGFKNAFKGEDAKDVKDAGGSIIDSLIEGLNDKLTLLFSFIYDVIGRGLQQKFIDIVNGVIGIINQGLSGINDLLFNNPFSEWLREKLGIEDIEPIQIPLIADLDPPPGTIYNEAKKEIEKKNKKDPPKLATLIKQVAELALETNGEAAVEKAKELWDSFKNTTVVKTIAGAKNPSFDNTRAQYDSVKDNKVTKTIQGNNTQSFKETKIEYMSFKHETATKTIKGATDPTYTATKKDYNGFISNVVTKTAKGAIDTTYNTAKKDFNGFTSNTATKTIKGAVDGSYTSAKNNYNGLVSNSITKTVSATLTSTYNSVKKSVDSLSNKSVTVTYNAAKAHGFDAALQAFYAIKDRVVTIWQQIRGKAAGGVYTTGSGWSDIPQYAGGTTNAHGSMFIAGEAGPEVVGHIGGRTEVLNKSQLASTMYSAVIAALRPLAHSIDTLFRYFSSSLASVITQINDTMHGPMSIVLDPSSLAALTSNFDTMLPAIVSGQIIPYATRLSALEDRVYGTDSGAVTNAELRKMLDDVIRAVDRVQFYIGDEQIARHAMTGSQRIDRRYNPIAQGV